MKGGYVLSLGEMAGRRAPRGRRDRAPKCVCAFCKECWEPRSTNAEKFRDYCYRPSCELANDQRISAKKRKYWHTVTKVKRAAVG